MASKENKENGRIDTLSGAMVGDDDLVLCS